MISLSNGTGDYDMSLMWRTKANHHSRLDNWFYRETGRVLRSEWPFTQDLEWRVLESFAVFSSHQQLRRSL